MHSHLYYRIMEYVSDFASILPPVLLAVVVYALARQLWLKRRGLPRNSWGNEGARLLLVCWLAGLLCLVWTPANFWHKLQYLIRYGWPMELANEWFQGASPLPCPSPVWCGRRCPAAPGRCWATCCSISPWACCCLWCGKGPAGGG